MIEYAGFAQENWKFEEVVEWHYVWEKLWEVREARAGMRAFPARMYGQGNSWTFQVGS
jgi:hypothetical protein